MPAKLILRTLGEHAAVSEYILLTPDDLNPISEEVSRLSSAVRTLEDALLDTRKIDGWRYLLQAEERLRKEAQEDARRYDIIKRLLEQQQFIMIRKWPDGVVVDDGNLKELARGATLDAALDSIV
jgi:hypothetical protein